MLNKHVKFTPDNEVHDLSIHYVLNAELKYILYVLQSPKTVNDFITHCIATGELA